MKFQAIFLLQTTCTTDSTYSKQALGINFGIKFLKKKSCVSDVMADALE